MKRYQRVCIGFLLATLLGLNAVFGQAIYIGMEKEALIEIMGAPSSQAVRGDRELLYFAGDIQVTLRSGKIRTVEGTEYGYFPPEQMAIVEQPPAGDRREVEEAKKAEAAAGGGMTETLAPPVKEEADGAHDSEQEMIDAVTDYNKFSSNQMSDEEAKEAFNNLLSSEMGSNEKEPHELMGDFEGPDEQTRVGTDMAVRFGVFCIYFLASLLVVKTTLIYFGITHLWREVFLVAIGYASFHLILSLVPYGADFRQLFKFDEIVGILVFTLLTFHLTSLNQGVTALKIGLIGAGACYFVARIILFLMALAAFGFAV